MAFVNGDAPHAFAFSAGVTALVFRAVSPTESNVHTVSYQQKQEQISQHGVFLGVSLQLATEFNRVAAEQQGDFGRDKIFGAPLFPKQRSHALAQQAVDNAEKWQSCFLKERKGGKISVGKQVSEKNVARRRAGAGKWQTNGTPLGLGSQGEQRQLQTWGWQTKRTNSSAQQKPQRQLTPLASILGSQNV